MENKQGKFTYGKIVHILIYIYALFTIKGKSIKSINIFKKIVNRNKYLFYNISKKQLNKFINLVWKVISNKKPTRFITFLNKLYNNDYTITLEKPIAETQIKVYKNGRIKSKAKTYKIDVFAINSKNKHIIILDIKSGTRRRKNSYYKKLNIYKDIVKQRYNNYKIDLYIYWFRYDKLEKVKKII